MEKEKNNKEFEIVSILRAKYYLDSLITMLLIPGNSFKTKQVKNKCIVLEKVEQTWGWGRHPSGSAAFAILTFAPLRERKGPQGRAVEKPELNIFTS